MKRQLARQLIFCIFTVTELFHIKQDSQIILMSSGLVAMAIASIHVPSQSNIFDFRVTQKKWLWRVSKADLSHPKQLGHYLLKSCFSTEISKNGMRVGGSLPLSIIHMHQKVFESKICQIANIHHTWFTIPLGTQPD